MKNLIIIGLLAVVALSAGCTYIEPGKVGIRVNSYGSQRGVEDYPIETGRVVYNPFTENIYEFPTFMQQAQWSKDGDNGDESVSFNSIEGAVLNVDVGIAYQINSEKVPHIFVKFRQDIATLTHGYLRTRVRDVLNRHAEVMKVTSIFGGGKASLLNDAMADLKKELEPEGFHIDNISFISNFRVDPQVEQSINLVISANQKATEAENKIRQSEAEAKQAQAVAEGKAQARLIEAKASAESNKLLTESLSPELLQYEALQKWDGHMPQVVGQGGVPFITVPMKEQVK
jgi:regulator of protease activity HflC (stomatin/prohibitin superfamily)